MTTDPGRAPILADLAFWMVASVTITAFSSSLAESWGAPRSALLIGSLAILALGVFGLPVLQRLRPMPRQLVRGFALGNLALTPLLLVLALADVLGLTASGNGAVAAAAGVTLVLGAWQFVSARTD